MNENQKLNPLTCELQVGDVVEVTGTEKPYIANVINTDGTLYQFSLRTEEGFITYRDRKDLRLISRGGKPVEEQWTPKSGEKVWNNVKKQVNVLFEFEGYWYLYGRNNGELMAQEIEGRHWQFIEPYTGQDKPVIDFGMAGLILTDGECIIVTTGHIENDYFSAEHLLYYPGITNSPHNKRERWRDITAEAMPIIEQLKQLMNGK